jgi:sulfane dehydrogenase subunit SoxC
VSLTHGLKRWQVNALLHLNQEALISQSELIDMLGNGGAIEVLEKFKERGVLKSSKPLRAEMKFELMAMQDYFTNNDLFFTYSRSPVPVVDLKTWKLSIEGDGVARPLSLNYNELLRLPYTTVTRYLECAGNGRIFYDLLLNKKADGEQWRFGGYGIADWTGVQLAEVLKLAGIKDNAVDVMPVGGDSSLWQRPFPVVKAMEPDTILAYIMNSKILPPDHGFPLRAILPGWVGAASIKWVNKIIVSTRPIHVAGNTNSYVLIGQDYAPQPPAKGPVITTQLVKSACCLPWPAALHAGHQKVVGYAWSPFGSIAKVEISIDGGKVFKPATLVGPNIERAGTRWEFHFDAVPGEMTIITKATDDQGNTQYPLAEQKWNKFGYLFGAMVPHPVTVTAHCCAHEEHADYSLVIPDGPGCC